MSDTFFYDEQVEQSYVDDATGVVEASDPFTQAEPDAFPRHLPQPANPQSPGLTGPSSRPSAPPPAPSQDPTVLQELAYLKSIADSLRGSSISLAITGEAVQPQLTEDYPFAGAKRWLIPRRPIGGKLIVPTTGYVEARAANRTRTGGTIVNNGAGAVWLALTNAREASMANVGMVWLSAGGGSWDFRLGPVLWSGAISAIAVVESELAIVEI